jgi:hypothetical protein
MALLVETHPSARVAAPVHPLRRRRTPVLHPVPATGVLVFPGVPDGVAAPAQLGPLMSPPTGTGIFGI